MTMTELTYRFKGDTPEDITVRLFDIRQVRDAEDPAPWGINVTIAWGAEIAFDRLLAGADPLHAVELACQFASKYIRGRAEDEGGTLDPPISP
ncbi:hypothetical protein [Sorangium cellulosum]|uniref:Uncharacterized protein n=1 Tax=Sorangium cellulosum So0157-2 TaxID=1254432 RepID=S4XZQ7_SORCE|nr:hypothetical protein [Sorangium cellulosum]AGP38717.1 hypothetical protein SCE1572_32075 [Sorangium cellulosum So0157-2]